MVYGIGSGITVLLKQRTVFFIIYKFKKEEK